MEDELKIELEEHIQDSKRWVSRNPDHYLGPEPWQLRPGEAGQLRIDLARYPRMLWAWDFFQMFLGIVHPNDFNKPENFFDEARKAHTDIFKQGMTPEAFTAFATHYAALTIHESDVIYARMNSAPEDATEGQGPDEQGSTP